MWVQPVGDALGGEQVLVVDTVRATVTFLLVYLVGRYGVRPLVMRLVRARNRNNRTLVAAFSSYLHVVAVVVALTAALVAAGYGQVLAGSALVIAALTIVVGVAGQEVVGDLVSGLFLVMDPEFNVGDWIAWVDGEGVVEAVGLRTTRVASPENEIVTVPNTTLAADAVTRPYGREAVRVAVRVSVSLEHDLAVAETALVAAAERTSGVSDDPEPAVLVEEISGGVRLRTEFWVTAASKRHVDTVRSAFLSEAVRELDAKDVTVDPPTGYAISGTLDVRNIGDRQR